MKFENLACLLSHKFSNNVNIDTVLNNIHSIAYKYFFGFKSFKVFSSIFTKADILLLKQFSKNPDIVVCRPDKGNGVVILDKTIYVNKMLNIISDSSKFVKINDDLDKYVLRVETKINNFLTKLKSLKAISESIYKTLRVTGSGPGILYGLPKIHKQNFSTVFPFRPIFAAYNTPSFNLAKFLVPVLKPLTTNRFTTDNSYSFVQDIIKIPNCNNYFMASFDVENLFTNVPVHETIEIILSNFFINSASNILGLSRKLFKQLLENSVLNSFFLFNGQLYRQKDGLGMGLPLGPTFANIFMCHHEVQWLEECPADFKPFLYRRYVDDTFVLFHDKSHAALFLDYLNSKHQNIKFTLENECNNKLNFLDISIRKHSGNFETSVFRKPSFSGLGMSYFSYICDQFKFNCVDILISRAYKICSDYKSFHDELQYLRSYFAKNGFPLSLIDFRISKFLNKLFSTPQADSCSTQAESDTIHFSLPYFGYQSIKMKSELNNIFTKFLPNFDFKIVLNNNFTISSLFNYKDKLPKGSRSSVVYEFSCAQCASRYVGSTTRALYIRVAEHAGRSFRTNRIITNPSNSNIRNHQQNCPTPISLEQFKIIGNTKSECQLRTLESLHIYKQKPVLNDCQSASKLLIVNR